MNNIIDYKSKYLKYKNKYLKLKGGAICPNIGFRNHLGECWHDSYSMILLYSDGIGDYIQNLFDRNPFSTSEEFINDIIEFGNYYMPDFFLPLHIYKNNPDDMSVFNDTAMMYLDNLYKRYINNKRDIQKADKPKKPGMLYRQTSLEETIFCTQNIFKLLKYRNKSTDYSYDIDNHGSGYTDVVFFITYINYFLLNYILPEERTQEKIYKIPTKYVRVEFFNFLIIFKGAPSIDKNTQIITTLTHINSLIDKSFGVTIDSVSKENQESHKQAFFTCSKEDFFYDDNGFYKEEMQIIEEEPQEEPKGESESSVELSSDILEENIFKRLEKYPKKTADDNYIKETMCKFKWRKYLKETIRKVIDTLTQANNGTITLISYDKLQKSFSNLYHGYDLTQNETVKPYSYNITDSTNPDLISYIYTLNFFILEDLQDADLNGKMNQYYDKNFELLHKITALPQYDFEIDINKVIELIISENIRELAIILNLESFNNLGKLKKTLEFARSQNKMKVVGLIENIISEF
jgi:hypothetical protein